MKGPAVQIVLWAIWTLILLAGLIFGVMRYRDGRADCEREETERGFRRKGPTPQ
jgi:hypothetical protein